MDKDLLHTYPEETSTPIRKLFWRMLIQYLVRYFTAVLLVLTVLAGGCQQSKIPQSDSKVILTAVGDVLLARGVGKEIDRSGFESLLADTGDIIRDSDLAFCNLECTLSDRGVPYRRKYIFRADPDYADKLSNAGFDVVSLANNHTLDFGRNALLDTIRSVEKAGILPVGAGVSRQDAVKVRVVVKNGLRVGFLAYTDIPTVGVARLADRPTVAGADISRIASEVKTARAQCDVLVVSFHWGIEYMKYPTERQRSLARACIDGGADLILGHHPHVLQPIETYKDKPIAYSMGGFLWDSRVLGADNSVIYRFELGKSSCRLIKTIPVKVVKCRPALVRTK
ncbi:MAG: CapA family protein [Armatimonadota bacterium]